MSIATLKKKTQAKYFDHSVGSQGFSLQGTHRNQGYVGQTMLSRSLPRTPMNGIVPCGSGGCCGKYFITPIVQSAVISQEDSTVVKSSVVGTYGMMSTKYRWSRRPQPYTTVKPDNNQIRSQYDYIKDKIKNNNKKINSCNNADGTKPVAPTPKCCPYVSPPKIGAAATITKPIKFPIPYDEYLLKLDDKCIENDIRTIPNLTVGTPLPGNTRSY
jgi:hypothetical protein